MEFSVVIFLLFSFCQSTSSALCSNKTSLRIRSVNVYSIKLVAFMNYGNSLYPEVSLSFADHFVMFVPNTQQRDYLTRYIDLPKLNKTFRYM